MDKEIKILLGFAGLGAAFIIFMAGLASAAVFGTVIERQSQQLNTLEPIDEYVCEGEAGILHYCSRGEFVADLIVRELPKVFLAMFFIPV